MTSGEELRQALRDAQQRPTAEQMYTQLQAQRAESGKALNQCGECGVFRADGQPPVLHHSGCSHADDWRADPLAFL